MCSLQALAMPPRVLRVLGMVAAAAMARALA